MKHRLVGSVAAVTVALAGGVQAAGVPGQGTWESTLQARDLDRDGVTDAFYDTEHRHLDTEYTARLALVNDAVAELGQSMRAANGTAHKAHAEWRQAVVQHLLLPINEVPAEAFRELYGVIAAKGAPGDFFLTSGRYTAEANR